MGRPLRSLSMLIAALVLAGAAATAALVIDGVTDEPGTSDVAVVLGNRVEPDGRPSPRLLARLDRALELYREGQAEALIVSGGTGREGFDEARVMRDYLVKRGVPASAVTMDSVGVDTRATAVNAAAIMRAKGWRSATVVSQYFHVPRSKLALSQEGVAEVRGAHPAFFEARDLYSIPREVIGYAAYTSGHKG